jgi:acetate kinase
MRDNILLTFNTGSSSLKLGMFRTVQGQAEAIGRGKIDFGKTPLALDYTIDGHYYQKLLCDDEKDFTSVIKETLDHLLAPLPGQLIATAHRVVHGGMIFKEACRLDHETIRQIEKLVPLAPLHQPQALRAIRALQELRPELSLTASFDTATTHSPMSSGGWQFPGRCKTRASAAMASTGCPISSSHPS